MALCSVLDIRTTHQQQEGGGFVVRRAFPSKGIQHFDPFLMLDELGPISYAPGEAKGAPDHPHRGFETVSYLLSGEVAHADSAGHSGVLHAGDVQWMTAGTGVVHREMPSEKMQIEGGVMHGFQLWVNLPRTHKNIPPRYQEVASDSITEVVHQNGLARVRVIAGSVLGVDSVIQTHVPILYLHVILQKEGKQSFNIPQGFRVGVYVFEGDMDVCGSQVGKGQFCILSEGDKCDLSSTSSGTQALVLGGIPIQEPIAWGGPFVMNTREEVMEAYRDFQEGRMGHISPEIIRA